MWWLLKKPGVVWQMSGAVTFFFSSVQVPPCVPAVVMVVELEKDFETSVRVVLEALDWDIPNS